MKLTLYIGRRLIVLAVLLLLISFVIFSMLAISPGGPEQMLLGTDPPTPEAIAAIRARYHLDDPFLVQYWQWLSSALQFDLGESIQTGEKVTAVLGDRLSVTAGLALYALILSLLVSIPAGLAAGASNGGLVDRAITTLTTFAVSAPSFTTGILLLYLFSVHFGWFPAFGAGDPTFADRIWHYTLPAIALALTMIALITRQTRAAALGVYASDATTFARARGLPGTVVWGRYTLLNSSLPVVTSTGQVIAYFLTGTVLVEAVFSIPGVGSLVVSSVTNKDIPLVQGVALFAAAVVLLVNFLADLAYMAIDPRVRKSILK